MKLKSGYVLLPSFMLFFSVIGSSCKEKKDVPSLAPPVKVSILQVSPEISVNSRKYSGTVSSASTTTVSFSVPGTITALYATEGQKVTKGQLLGKVRNGEYQNAYNITEAQLAEAQDGYDRLKKLHDANALPEIKWVEIQQKLKQAQNAMEMAKRTLEDANLHSPATGTITQKFIDVGETVMPIEPIYEIAAIEKLTVDIPVPESQIGSFSIGEKADVKIDAIGDAVIEGRISSKSVTSDPITRSYEVKVAINNVDGRILPGMIAGVTFSPQNIKDGEEEAVKQSIILPSQAVLLNDNNRWFVWIVEDSVSQRRFVEVDELVAEGVKVTSGLKSGDRVIVAGMQKVGSGTRVVY